MSGPGELREQARAFVRGLAVNFGATVTTTASGSGAGWEAGAAGLSEPLAGVRAGRLVAAAARELTADAARDARSQGRSWDDIGDALALFSTVVPADRARAAFQEIAGDLPDACLVWTCGTCRRSILDHGPYFGDPDQDQDGHATGCARHAGEVAVWQARSTGTDGGCGS